MPFTLPGFGSFKREGIELTTNFTAQVNPELKVGTLEETITVAGASPIVDVQSAQVSQQVKTETVDLLPTGRAVQSIAKVLPGITISGGERGGGGGRRYRGVSIGDAERPWVTRRQRLSDRRHDGAVGHRQRHFGAVLQSGTVRRIHVHDQRYSGGGRVRRRPNPDDFEGRRKRVPWIR